MYVLNPVTPWMKRGICVFRELFSYKSPNQTVHLSTQLGEASRVSTSAARRLGEGSLTKASTWAAVGIRPVRSSVTRRTNSKSVVGGAGATFAAASAGTMYLSMVLPLGRCTVSVRLPPGADGI